MTILYFCGNNKSKKKYCDIKILSHLVNVIESAKVSFWKNIFLLQEGTLLCKVKGFLNVHFQT